MMNWRERLANLISGGALTRYRDAWLTAEYGIEQATDAYQAADKEAARYKAALERIAAMETPGANGTVKKMARAAREALE